MNIRVAGLLLVIVFSVKSTLSNAQAKKPAQARLSAASAARGKIVYTNTCLPCHMADGGGVPNMNPPLIQTKYVLGDKAKIISIVLNGFDEEIEINGQHYTNTMPPQVQLSDQQIADVLTFVRSNFGNKASAVTLAEVKKIKASSTK